jgi:transposase InsO family protein
VTAFVDEHRGRFGVEPICRTLGVSASAYHQRKTGARSRRDVEDERLLGRIRELHAANYYAYGSRRMWIALRRLGEPVARCTVERLMRTHGICGAKRRGKPWRTTRPDPAARRRPDLVDRDFTARGPNELWVADITYLRCWEGVVFFAFIIDAYSRRIVGWQLAGHMRTTLVLDALRMALHQRGGGADVELVHHSDRGSQGGFKWSSQHLDDEELRWGSRGGVGLIARGGRRCGRRVGLRSRGVRIGNGSGRRSPTACRVMRRAWLPVCRRRSASGGFVRVAACHRSAGRRCRGAICRSSSARRSRS